MARRSGSGSQGGGGGPLESAVLQWGVLIGVFVLAVITGLQWQQVAKLEKDLAGGTAANARVSSLEARVDALAKAQPPQPRRDPDPAKVHTVNTTGSPARGAAGAPIVIAEFSDYQ